MISFLQPTVRNSNGGFTTLVILIVTGASRNAISGPVKFPVNRPGKLTGPVITGSFEKRAPETDETNKLAKNKIRFDL